MKALACVVLFIALCIGSGFVMTAPMLDPVCEARVIVEHSTRLTECGWMETINVMEESGGIDKAHASELRALVKEAYSVPDRAAWVKQKCASTNVMKNNVWREQLRAFLRSGRDYAR